MCIVTPNTHQHKGGSATPSSSSKSKGVVGKPSFCFDWKGWAQREKERGYESSPNSCEFMDAFEFQKARADRHRRSQSQKELHVATPLGTTGNLQAQDLRRGAGPHAKQIERRAEMSMSSSIPSSTLPSQSAAYATYAEKTIVGFGFAIQVAVITGQGKVAMPSESKMQQGEDEEMIEHTKEEDPESQHGIRTPLGKDDSFACARSGFGHNFKGCHESKQEASLGDSERFMDSLGFEGEKLHHERRCRRHLHLDEL